MRLCGLYLLLFSVRTLFAQVSGSPIQFDFIPGKLAVIPLTTSPTEPRVGLRKQLATSSMRLDIGASVDMLQVMTAMDSTDRFRIGIDFFTYALSTNSEGLRLQIDAVDGFFGGHVAYLHDLDKHSRLILRLRLLHISAHFLDGHFNLSTRTWKGNREPIPFTRDFGELLTLYDFPLGEFQARAYGGFSYATLVRPTSIKRFEFQAGFELHSDNLTGTVFSKPFNLYIAENFLLRGIPNYVGTNTVEFGMKFGEWNSTGLKVFASYYAGLDEFSQYFDVRREHWGLGFTFDFW